MFGEAFWVSLAFIVFVAAVYRPVSKMMGDALDGRAEKIRGELDEAVRLREEAQTLLAGYERQQNGALKEAEGILAHARDEAERQAVHAAEALEELIRRREAQAMDRIARAEEDATAGVRAAAVDLAIQATRKLLTSELDEARRAKLVDDAIGELDDKLH
ncbi:MAG: F0F1 ATP synthase subunit B [Pseudomonadota bacterium]|nr:F0F1 ATP synthase subunit B [Pseudomonadota bacterium]